MGFNFVSFFPRAVMQGIPLLFGSTGEISTAFSLNQSFADILTGIILFFIIATEFFITYKVTLRKSSKKEA